MASRRSARLASMVSSSNISDPAPPPPPAVSRKRKGTTQTPAIDGEDAAPSTPRKRRANKTADVPETPTPAAVNLIAEEAHTRRPKPAAVARLADPSRTNALLRSPKTSRIIAPAPVEPVPSSLGDRSTQQAAGTATTTSANILEEACAHLIRVDPRMKPLIDKHHCHIFSPEGLAEQIDPFESLCSSIISQQVSGAAAKTIKARFVALFGDSDSFPRPEQVASVALERLRPTGLSQRKAEYLRGLAGEFASGALTAQGLAEAPYEALVERLTAVRGLGRWTVDMFACFALKRMDVFSTGDLGVQRGMAAFVGRDVARLKKASGGSSRGGGKWKYMSEKEMVEISDRFRPYRSVFMWYMWRVEDTDISTMES